jgi:sugar phosphate permease
MIEVITVGAAAYFFGWPGFISALLIWAILYILSAAWTITEEAEQEEQRRKNEENMQ